MDSGYSQAPSKFFLTFFASGGAGGIVGQANFAPELCVAFYEAFRQNRRKLAGELFARLLPLATEVNLKYGVPAVKAAMDISGFRGGEPRSPCFR